MRKTKPRVQFSSAEITYRHHHDRYRHLLSLEHEVYLFRGNCGTAGSAGVIVSAQWFFSPFRRRAMSPSSFSLSLFLSLFSFGTRWLISTINAPKPFS